MLASTLHAVSRAQERDPIELERARDAPVRAVAKVEAGRAGHVGPEVVTGVVPPGRIIVVRERTLQLDEVLARLADRVELEVAQVRRPAVDLPLVFWQMQVLELLNAAGDEHDRPARDRRRRSLDERQACPTRLYAQDPVAGVVCRDRLPERLHPGEGAERLAG